VGTKSEACHAADNIMREVEKHVAGKDVWRKRDQGPFYRNGIIDSSETFAAALSWMRIIGT